MTRLGADDPDESDGKTAAETLCALIRQRIITGEFPGGERLTEEQLAAEFSASRMTIREALRLLNAEGFIRIRPYFGTFVAQISAKEVADLLELHGAIESLAASLAAERRTAGDVDELKELVALGRAAASEGNRSESRALHGRFHRVLARASDNQSLTSLMIQMRFKTDWVYATRVTRPAIDSWKEHSDIVRAVELRDTALAAATAKAHVAHAARTRAKQEPDLELDRP